MIYYFYLFEEWRCHGLKLNVEWYFQGIGGFLFSSFVYLLSLNIVFMVIYACKYIKLVQECILHISFKKKKLIMLFLVFFIYIKTHVKRGAKNLPTASKFPSTANILPRPLLYKALWLFEITNLMIQACT